MSACLVIEVTPTDLEKFGEYERGTVPIARDADPMPVERDHKPALGVILKFPDKQAVRDFFDSAEYAPCGRSGSRSPRPVPW